MSRKEPLCSGTYWRLVSTLTVPVCMHIKPFVTSDKSDNTCGSARRLSVTTSTRSTNPYKKSIIDPLWTGRCLWYCFDLSNSLSELCKNVKSSSVFEIEHNTQPLQYLICATRCSVITDRGLHIPKFNQEQ